MGPAKHAKRRERGREVWAGRPAHVTSRDPTLDAVGTRSCAIRRGMSKKRATAIFDLSLRVGRNWEIGRSGEFSYSFVTSFLTFVTSVWVILSVPDLVRAFRFFSSFGCLGDHHAQVMVLGCLGKAIKRFTRFHVTSHALKTGCNRNFVVGQARGHRWILIAPDITRTIALVIIAL